MEENLNDFIWQIVVVIMLIGAIGLMIIVDQQVQETQELTNELITDKRTIIENVPVDVEYTISGAELVLQMTQGLEVPIIINQARYEVDEIYDLENIELSGIYNRNEIIDGDGQIIAIQYERTSP